jgi:hypothetical protein
LRIELLHFEGCPGFTETLGILERAVAEEGMTAEISPVTLGPDDWASFPGSPTILVDGEDLFPTKRGEAHAPSCRVYPTPKGPKNHPTTTMVREALMKRLSRNQHVLKAGS